MTTSEFCHNVWCEKHRKVGLYRSVKKFDNTFSRLTQITECDRQTDGQTDVINYLSIALRVKKHEIITNSVMFIYIEKQTIRTVRKITVCEH